jgi:hypothetical protein
VMAAVIFSIVLNFGQKYVIIFI